MTPLRRITPQPASIRETFAFSELSPYWRPWATGSGRVEIKDRTLYCILNPTQARTYSDAQITDYSGLPRRAFPWRPPLRLTVRAWASHDQHTLKGTAGFGFWNEPFVPGQRGLPRPPRAVWFFFASPPSNMALAQDVPGWGWKAATIDASRPAFWLLTPTAPFAFPLMRLPRLYRTLWPVAQRALGVSETPLAADLSAPHTYCLDWYPDGMTFAVDGKTIHASPHAPRGPLGFIAWIDNQFAVVTPQGRFRFGTLPIGERQWLALDQIVIEPL